MNRNSRPVADEEAAASNVAVNTAIPEASETSPLLGSAPLAAEQQTADDGETTVLATDISATKVWLIMLTTYVGVFLGAIDASIIATLSAPISSEFKSLSLFSWLATAYLIANAACQPLSGRLTDIFGRGPGLIFSNFFFGVGNLMCGLAQSDSAMVAGRVVAGMGGGGLMSIATFLASDLVPLRKRGIIQGIGNIAYGSGAMLGGVFGGVINDHTAYGWRLAFLVQVPVCLISLILVAVLVRVPPKVSNKSLVNRIDFGGASLIVGFLVLLLLGLSAGGNVVPWTHPLVLATIPLSVLALIALFWWEKRTPQPIVPVRLMLDRTVLMSCLTSMLCNMSMMMTVFYIPLYLQVRGYSASESGLRLVVTPLAVSISSVSVGIIMQRTGKYVALGVISMLFFCAGAGSAIFLDEHAPAWAPFFIYFLLGFGFGGMLIITLLACIAAVAHSEQAVITSGGYAFRSVGSTLGITIGSAVYQNLLKQKLWERFGHLDGAAEEIARIRNDLSELQRLPPGWYQGVIDSFMEAFRGVWIAGLGTAVVGLVCISFIKQHTLHSTLERR